MFDSIVASRGGVPFPCVPNSREVPLYLERFDLILFLEAPRFMLRVLRPDKNARRSLILNLLSKENHCLDEPQIDDICKRTQGYSGADMAALTREAAYGPIRSVTDIKVRACCVRRPMISDSR